jgi:hypothetical protein
MLLLGFLKPPELSLVSLICGSTAESVLIFYRVKHFSMLFDTLEFRVGSVTKIAA